MNIFIICSVRGTSKEYRKHLEQYAAQLILDGHKVYLPHRDTSQTDTGINICSQNKSAIHEADEVHIFYSSESKGTHFDMGVAFAMDKRIKIVESIHFGEGKSFPRMLKEWEAI